jgi:hypothetical protein
MTESSSEILYNLCVGLMAYQVNVMVMCGPTKAISAVRYVIGKDYLQTMPTPEQVFEIINKAITEVS